MDWRFWRRRSEQRSISFQDYWGSAIDASSPVKAGSMETALRLIPVYAANRLISETIASFPLQAYRKVGLEHRQPIKLPPLFEDPTVFGTTHEWVQRAVSSLVLRGNAFGYVTEFTGTMTPRRIEWLHPDEVEPLDNRAVARPRWFWLGREVEPDRMVHIPGLVLPGQILGLSPIRYFAMTTETGLLAQEFGRDWFRNGAVPSAILEAEGVVTEDQANIVKKRFMQAARGREPVALGSGVKYRAITVPPDEARMIETLKLSVNQIASIYGIPAERIGGESGSSRSYANREQDSLDLLTYSLQPYITKLEAHFFQLLARPQYVKFNADAVVRADLKTRYEAHSMALADGWKSKDEVRSTEDLPPLPDGQGVGYGPPPAPALPMPPEPGPDGERSAVQLRAADADARVADATRRLSAFFRDQGAAVLDTLDGQRDVSDLFDTEHWNGVLIPVLVDIALRVSRAAGRATLGLLGLDPGDYDTDRTAAWIAAHASGVASGINGTTRALLEGALGDDDPSVAVRHLFTIARTSRAESIAQTEVTAAAGFGTREAGQQSGLELNKTWHTGSNPRATHARMNGETVRLDDDFSNGARWPGDSRLDDKERARCNCSMDVDKA